MKWSPCSKTAWKLCDDVSSDTALGIVSIGSTMSLEDISKRDSVLAAIEECRRIGRDAFLQKYGFRPAREYHLVVDGERFDSKAILGAAHGFEFPERGPLRSDQFSGGAATVAPKLKDLGFTVVRDGADAVTSDSVSKLLQVGAIYTREDLKKVLDTQDATINTGIFRPSGFSSVLIFITKNKTSDRTQYEDHLDGDTLHCQGQSAGRTDSLIIEHRQRGLELLVFYRDSKYEYPGAGFRFEGLFNYVSHAGTKPTNFVLNRAPSDLSQATIEAEGSGAFDPSSIEDARKKTFAAIVRRQGQPAFRKALLKAYEGKCAVTGCAIEAVLEAAHILPYQGPLTNHVGNGLLLRADLHTLFDLGLMAIDESTLTVIVAPSLHASDYGQWHGKPLHLPSSASDRPSVQALLAHRTGTGLHPG